MRELPARLFACDPGLASGVAELAYDGQRLEKVSSAELDPPGTCAALERFVSRYGPEEAAVVYERFTITVQTAKNTQAPWSLELIGAAKYLVSSLWGTPFDRSILLVNPADHMGLVPNELMKVNDIWHRGGKGHAREALRIGVYTYAKMGLTYFWDALEDRA
jgi:hypothetical protein